MCWAALAPAVQCVQFISGGYCYQSGYGDGASAVQRLSVGMGLERLEMAGESDREWEREEREKIEVGNIFPFKGIDIYIGSVY